MNLPNTIFPHIFFLLTLIHSAIALITTCVNVTCESLKQIIIIDTLLILIEDISLC